ncbi:MAG: FprA family A-type flavoprotein [Culturomica sp.]|jgi:flavorubredoxin|nr:FprA family A-type flavoprotein [Culturomica sp.]
MNQAVEITNGIFRIGANDRKTHFFENYLPLPKGVAYNSYVIVDEKVAVIDTIERSHLDDYIENLQAVLNGRKVDYLIINHMEPDHSSAIKTLLCHFPGLTLVGNAKTFPMLENFYGVHENLLEVQEGSTLNLGKRQLNFYMAPMLHWPETMVTYVPEEGILFSADIFGAFGTLDGGIFDDQTDLDYLEEEISRYYSNIVGKYGAPAQTALKKLGGLSIRMICATHGPIWRTRIADIIARYDKWSKYETDEGVVIAFSSMYGHTEKMADLIGRFLAEKGIKKIRIHDTSKTHPSYIINDIFRYKGVILGSCSYNGNIFPTMETLLSELEHIGVKNHLVAFFANKSWAGGALPRFTQFVDKIKWEIVAPHADASGSPKERDLEACRNIAYTMADRLQQKS